MTNWLMPCHADTCLQLCRNASSSAFQLLTNRTTREVLHYSIPLAASMAARQSEREENVQNKLMRRRRSASRSGVVMAWDKPPIRSWRWTPQRLVCSLGSDVRRAQVYPVGIKK